jgi:hypothetical protein
MGIVGRDPDIGAQCLFQAAAIAVTMDGCDHGLGQGQQAGIQTILETFCVRRHDPFDIGTDTKRTALAAKDTYPEIGVIFKIIPCIRYRVIRLTIAGIHNFRAVDSDVDYAV